MDGGGADAENKIPAEGEMKVKRKMKTAFQLEILEKTYAVESYPSEQLRADLSLQLGLTDRQLQMWFCHRRLKDRKTPPVKRPKKEISAGGVGEAVLGSGEGLGGNGSGGSGSGSSPNSQKDRVVSRASPVVSGSVIASGSEMSSVKRYYQSPHAVSEARAVAFVEAQLGERLREDGPILGMEFDPLPPGAFGAPIVQPNLTVRPYEAKLYERSDAKPVKIKSGFTDLKANSQGGVKPLQEYQFLPEQPSVRNDSLDRATPSQYYGSLANASSSRAPMLTAYSVPGPVNILPPQQGRPGPSVEIDNVARKSSSTVSLGIDTSTPPAAHLITGIENPFVTPAVVTHEEEITRIERKRKSEEARIAKEVEAHEKRIRKELEKQDMMRRKREEQMRKEMERQDRERRKEEERLLRERQREEERYQREQRREMERRVKFLQKESIRAEKLRLKEDMRREKEAARLKAANDRAAARRIAKESLELIDDERLELMEIAAKTKGLPSMMSLDSDTLKNIESLRDMLPEFPPKSVHLKKPFTIQPWTDSEENIGNLLMVWKFLITFADVLGLWPFTLDEFIQAFHDHDPRLLGEIHVALIKSIVKDIEDVSRVPTSSLGPNQASAPNPGGGHPHIVEGAFAWGFDIRSWQRHLSPLTWPEILRQFALSAGYGPKLTKRSADQAHPREENEGVSGGDIISNLRSGAAAENAFAIMQERGFSNKRSRHRLTPGTVKYAAFHILSLEDSNGLSILDVAEKIQKSGLRDLTTSKTPEASIAAALSRDTKLFERTAPSTYCLKTPYRKDPADRDAIINAALEKIHRFKNGYFDGEEAFDPERDDAEKDDDSESDIPNDPEVDDISIGNSGVKLQTPMKVDILDDRPIIGKGVVDEDNIVDESVLGESWVQGLMESEYSDLSVEERLNALVALTAVANEGNSVRVVLEERLEAAMAIKKQMWAEAQIDKRHMKEDFIMKIQYPAGDDLVPGQENMGDPQNDLQPAYAVEKSRAQLKSLIGHKAEEMFVYRSLPLGSDRRRNRYWQFITSASQNDPGSGRIFVELCDGRWRLIDTEESFNDLLASLDVRGNREANLHSMLQRIESRFKDSINKTRANVSGAGTADSNSPSSSLSVPNTNVSEFSSSFTIELGTSGKEIANALKRCEDFEKWMWGECFNLRAMTFGNTRCEHILRICDNCRDLSRLEDDPCFSCHKLFETCFNNYLPFSNHISRFKEKLKWDSDLYFHNRDSGRPVRFRLLKAQLALIEASIPLEALQPSWTDECRKSWCMKLVDAVTVESLLGALTILESVIKRDFLSRNFETTDELLGSNNSALLHTNGGYASVSMLPWLPETTSSIGLRLMELDTCVHYLISQKEDAEKDKPTNFLTSHPKYEYASLMKNGEDGDNTESLLGTGSLQDTWADPSGSGRVRGRGRGRGRARGGRAPRSVGGVGRSGAQLRARGGRGGRKGGRRGARTKPQKTVKIANDNERDNREFIYEESPVVGFQEWNDEEIADLRVTENVSSSEYEAENENENNGVDEYDDMLVDDGYQNVYDDVAGRGYAGEYGLGGEEEDDEDEDDDQGGVDVDGFFNDDGDADGGQIGNNANDETEMSSSGYSD
ncbi:homeobox-DDT domain protein RLT2-like [Bidens hawaiensis]|uniref:homeobox-DDT domain protein RLT2-like n=1 Tax=Bidens hawaiensis TaxID=980011 RepID=UPI00404AF0DE